MPRSIVRFTIVPGAVLLSIVGLARADGGGFTFLGDYHLGQNGALQVIDGVVAIGGDFDVAIDDAGRFDLTRATLQFIGLPDAGPFEIEAMAEDIGFCDLTLPDPALFSIELLRIGPSRIRTAFVDQHDNALGIGGEALYVQTLLLETGTTLDVRGLNLYYQTLIPSNAGQPGSGVSIVDSVGGGGVYELGTDSPNPPSGAVTTDNEICAGDSTTVSATADPGLVLDWYTDDCGVSPSNRPLGTFVGTGNPLEVSPMATTVYRAQSRNPLTGCVSRSCTNSVTVIVHDNPLCTVSSTPVVCTDEAGLTASVQNAGANTTYAWTVSGGTIDAGQNTDTISFTADNVPVVIVSVVISKDYFDGDGSTCVTSCQTTVSTDAFRWTGPDGGSFTQASHWAPATVPGTITPGGDAVLDNTSGVFNRCVFDDPGASILACNARISASGAGRQALEIHEGSRLATTIATTVDNGGDILLRGGEIAGGPLINRSNSVSGYGVVSSDVLNQGRLESRAGRDVTLMLTGGHISNAPTGLVRTTLGSVLLVQAGSVTQSGSVEIQTLSGILVDGPLTNSAGGQINLLGGALGADGLINELGATLFGFGTIQSSVDNDGQFVTAADSEVIGDLVNNGFVIIQNGLLTVTGTVSGSGTIIGGLGGRDGGAAFEVGGSFDISTPQAALAELGQLTLRITGAAPIGFHEIEVFAADAGPNGIATAMLGSLVLATDSGVTRLADRHRNAPGAVAEALYVGSMTLSPGTTLDLAGRRLYVGRVLGADRAPGRVIDTVGGGRCVQIGGGRKAAPH